MDMFNHGWLSSRATRYQTISRVCVNASYGEKVKQVVAAQGANCFRNSQKYTVLRHRIAHANTHRNTYTHTHISHPIQTSLRSQHLPLSKPAVSNINYPQDVFTLCVDPNTSDTIAVPMPHTLLKGCLVNLNPANPPWPPAAGMTLPPSFTPSAVLIRLIYYAP